MPAYGMGRVGLSAHGGYPGMGGMGGGFQMRAPRPRQRLTRGFRGMQLRGRAQIIGGQRMRAGPGYRVGGGRKLVSGPGGLRWKAGPAKDPLRFKFSRARSHMYRPPGVKGAPTGILPGTREMGPSGGWRSRATLTEHRGLQRSLATGGAIRLPD